MKDRSSVIRILTVIVGTMGLLMLIGGMLLFRLEQQSRRTADVAQMPEEMIAEFFSDSGEPQIEDFIEPEAPQA